MTINRYNVGGNDDIELHSEGWFVDYEDHAKAIAQLRAENAALRVDAERYRWLRKKTAKSKNELLGYVLINDCDEAIDNAIAIAARASLGDKAGGV